MPDLFATVTLGTAPNDVMLLANVGGLEPLQAETPMTVFQGIDSTTVQVFPRRVKGTTLTLEAKGDGRGDAGFITDADFEKLQAMADGAGDGTAVAYVDSFGNVGTVLVRKVSGQGQAGDDNGMFSLHLELVWVTLTQRLGVAYTGP
jgi:hypothetical protein